MQLHSAYYVPDQNGKINAARKKKLRIVALILLKWIQKAIDCRGVAVENALLNVYKRVQTLACGMRSLF